MWQKSTGPGEGSLVAFDRSHTPFAIYYKQDGELIYAATPCCEDGLSKSKVVDIWGCVRCGKEYVYVADGSVFLVPENCPLGASPKLEEFVSMWTKIPLGQMIAFVG